MGRHGPERHDDEGRQEERAMKLGLSIGYSGAELTLPVEKVLLAERLGFDSVWTAEAYGSDAISPLAYLAAVTKRIRLGTGIMQLAARPPVSAAMAAGTLDALAGGGRVIAGLGVSGPPDRKPNPVVTDPAAGARRRSPSPGPSASSRNGSRCPT